VTSVWTPQFVCPECGGDAGDDGRGRSVCRVCNRCCECRDGIWRFLTATRQSLLEPFVQQYRIVREREGYRLALPDFYRRLPSVASDDPHAAEWRIRRESFAHLEREVLQGGDGLRVLDLGAGSAWLSNRLASRGHHAVAVDVLDDQADGLGAAQHYTTEFVAVQADFEALPFVPGQFDVAVFNGSLHYARNVASALEHARQMLVAEGRLVVMDSPLFHGDRDGCAMLDDKHRRFRSEHKLRAIVQPGAGYLTFAGLAAVAERWKAAARFVPTRGPIGWRVRRHLSRVRLRRAPAAFGLWVVR
jgi:SAM-dependent methyltransferase